MPDVKHSFLIFGQRPNAIFGKTRKILFIEMTKFSRYRIKMLHPLMVGR